MQYYGALLHLNMSWNNNFDASIKKYFLCFYSTLAPRFIGELPSRTVKRICVKQ